LFTRIIFGDEYKALRSSLCSLLHSPLCFIHLLDKFRWNCLWMKNTFGDSRYHGS
jgi:hypothetical protein